MRHYSLWRRQKEQKTFGSVWTSQPIQYAGISCIFINEHAHFLFIYSGFSNVLRWSMRNCVLLRNGSWGRGDNPIRTQWWPGFNSFTRYISSIYFKMNIPIEFPLWTPFCWNVLLILCKIWGINSKWKLWTTLYFLKPLDTSLQGAPITPEV